MEALTLLKDEHSTILQQVYEMDKLLGLLESSGPRGAAKLLRQLLEASKVTWTHLSYHTAREEKILFPVLEKRLGANGESVEVMRREHSSLLESLVSLRSEIEKMVEDHDTIKTWNLASRLQELRGTLSDHMSREENVLFWLAELHLSELDQRKIVFDLTEPGQNGQ